jgi:hypothetical protein
MLSYVGSLIPGPVAPGITQREIRISDGIPLHLEDGFGGVCNVGEPGGLLIRTTKDSRVGFMRLACAVSEP